MMPYFHVLQYGFKAINIEVVQKTRYAGCNRSTQREAAGNIGFAVIFPCKIKPGPVKINESQVRGEGKDGMRAVLDGIKVCAV